ncbi:hypothetical protein [Microbacterium sp. WCS2018Hpa-23]|uniref:hypothetical protein n=1 Tax=Microbacterium sp. WCS2018Hpa-23 TaxID=3073634 RepID=UPI002882DA65|nr:hypothetical protein [Microbacterium sp. WCS2018Hpa-23]
MSIDDDGRATIPAELRHRLDFEVRDRGDLIDNSRNLHIVRSQSGEQAVDRVRGVLPAGRTTAQVMEITRGE